MSLKGILSISGMPGLYKVVAQTKSGFIVESLNDKKRMPVSSTQQISMLEDISVYTNTDDIPLSEVFIKMIGFSKNNTIINAKSDAGELRNFLKQALPEYDSERVYPSDIKKMINWFHLVKDIVEIKDDDETDEEQETPSEAEPVNENKSEDKE